jgi:hypothetical protein
MDNQKRSPWYTVIAVMSLLAMNERFFRQPIKNEIRVEQHRLILIISNHIG